MEMFQLRPEDEGLDKGQKGLSLLSCGREKGWGQNEKKPRAPGLTPFSPSPRGGAG